MAGTSNDPTRLAWGASGQMYHLASSAIKIKCRAGAVRRGSSKKTITRSTPTWVIMREMIQDRESKELLRRMSTRSLSIWTLKRVKIATGRKSDLLERSRNSINKRSHFRWRLLKGAKMIRNLDLVSEIIYWKMIVLYLNYSYADKPREFLKVWKKVKDKSSNQRSIVEKTWCSWCKGS